MSGVSAYSQRAGARETEALVMRHAELVKRIAYHLAGRLPASVEVDDLIQAGMLGLLEAASNYSAGRGASFETYAGIRIRGAMLDGLRKLDWAPRSVHRKARAAAAAVREIEAEFGREARDSEIADKMGVSLDEYHKIAHDAASCRIASARSKSRFAPDAASVSVRARGPRSILTTVPRTRHCSPTPITGCTATRQPGVDISKRLAIPPRTSFSHPTSSTILTTSRSRRHHALTESSSIWSSGQLVS